MKKIDEKSNLGVSFDNICQEDGIYSPANDFSIRIAFKEGEPFYPTGVIYILVETN